MRERIESVDVIDQYPELDDSKIDLWLQTEIKKNKRKIIVLDDDPTGVQTVHGVYVYTNWDLKSMKEGFLESNMLFFILTNSRGFTEEQTSKVHNEIAQNVNAVSKELNIPYLFISRSDSTLRGHYPLETELLRKQMKQLNNQDIDGEILCPYFKEGGRVTMNNVHYVRYGNQLIPAGETEFAKDETFGYRSSNLCEYVEEKTKGAYRKEDCICVTLEMLQAININRIEEALLNASGFQKIIVNAVNDMHVKVFAIALFRAMEKKHSFLIRSAAALVKAMAGIPNQALLEKRQLISEQNQHGGIIIIGSHTKKTNEQLKILKDMTEIQFIEMNSDLVLRREDLEKEVERIVQQENDFIASGKTVCVYTRRTLLKFPNDTPQDALLRSVSISDALQACVGKLTVKPAFIVAKGGITSSDVGTKALRVTKALVLGQIQPGIPVWQTGKESLFPGIPYVIFPGNVGEVYTLQKVVETFVK